MGRRNRIRRIKPIYEGAFRASLTNLYLVARRHLQTSFAICLLSTASTGTTFGGSPGDALTEIDRAETLWRSAASNNYSFTVRYSEFLGQYGCFTQTYVVSGHHSKSETSGDCEYRPDKLGTIPALFKLMRKTLRRPWEEIAVEFDETLGYPKKFYTGSGIADDYFQFEVSEFKVIHNTSLDR